MNMEHLTKTQLVLLTLLVSFVTSIATGIMTVSLLQEAPATVSQTINRVVERTIERVVTTPEGTRTVREVQVVSEDDKVTAAITKNMSSVVRIRQIGPDGSPTFYAIGVVISQEGEIIAERTPLFVPQYASTGTFADGTTVNLAIQKDVPEPGVILFRAASVPVNGVTPATFTKSIPKLGQTVVVIEGQIDNVALVGHISNIQGTSSTSPRTIETDFDRTRATNGSPLIDLSGDIVGIRRSDLETGRFFIYSPLLLEAVR